MDPRYPVGKFNADPDVTADKRRGWIAEMDALPSNLARVLDALPGSSLDTPYREGGWTVRQAVHHLADSHLNAYIRIKLALTEDAPTIKTYEEAIRRSFPTGGRWSRRCRWRSSTGSTGG